MRQQTKAAQTGWTAAGIVMICLLFFFAALLPGEAYAAAKTKAKAPARTVITGADVNCNFVELQWEKARRATSYRVFVQTGKNGWKYWKSVKRTAKNKKKYADTLKYRLKKSGTKYRVYKRKNPYRKAAAGIKALSFTYQGKFDTSCRFVVQPVRGKKLGPYSKAKTVQLPSDVLKTENVSRVLAYAQKVYDDNRMDDYTKGGFTWNATTFKISWLYFNGFILESYLQLDPERYSGEIIKFFNQNIRVDEDGTAGIRGYSHGELDAAMPAAPMLQLVLNGSVSEEERANYQAAANYVYRQLEKQTIYPQAGNLWQHSQHSDGTPRRMWREWNICLDGVYMSQFFLVRLTQAIDAGLVEVISTDGTRVSSEQLWNDIYSRCVFVMEHMRNPENGLLYHGYQVEKEKTNEITWSRGMGWYAMALLEAAEHIPDKQRQEVLTDYFRQLSDAIVSSRDENSSLWYNVTDGREEYFFQKKDGSGEKIYNIPETSGSAMFTYCLLKGYHDGLLRDPQYRKAGLESFNALVEQKLTDDGLIDIYSSSSVTSDKDLYQRNGYVTNEAKGISPLLLAARYAY